jgi:cytoskeleton protein RodZ
LIKAERPVNEVEKEVAGVDVSGESVSPGDTLRKLREKRNLSIADVAQHLKYGVRQIEALERDDFQNLPGMTFVRGMTRSYAKLLGSNPTQLLSELEQRRLPEQVTVDLRTTQIPFPDGSKRATRL